MTGSEEKGNISLRYGGQIGSETPFRVYVKGFERHAAVDVNGDDTVDDWRYLRGVSASIIQLTCDLLRTPFNNIMQTP